MNRIFFRSMVLVGLCAGLGCSSNNPAGPGDGGDAGGTDSGWNAVGTNGGEPSTGASYGRIAAGGGKVYVAYSDGNVNGQLTVMVSDGSTWSPVGAAGFSPSAVDPSNLAIAVDASGAPWVAYTMTDSGSGDSVITVEKYSGGSWSLQGAGGFSSNSATISLAIAGGAPYVAFVDSTGAGHVMTLGSAWTELGGLSSAPTSVENPVLGTDGTTVYVAYDDYDTSKLVLAKLAGSTWTTVASTTITIDDNWSPSVSVSNGTVWIGYENSTSGPVVMQLVGSSLENVGSLGSIANGDEIETVTSTVYNGVPYVAFDDESRDSDPDPRAATVKYWDGTQWALYAGYPNPCDIEDTVITSDPSNGHLYLTYQDCNGFMSVVVH